MSTLQPQRQALLATVLSSSIIRTSALLFALALAANTASAATINSTTTTAFGDNATFTLDDSNSNVYWDISFIDNKDATDPIKFSKTDDFADPSNPTFNFSDGQTLTGPQSQVADGRTTPIFSILIPANTEELITIWMGNNTGGTASVRADWDDDSDSAALNFTGNQIWTLDVTTPIEQELDFSVRGPSSASKDGSSFSGVFAVGIATVPEPASLSLMAAGVAGLMIRRRRVV